MKKSRTINTLTNILFGILNKIVNIIFPFIIRSVIIYTIGTQYLGLNTLFSSILQILNLAEMGLSSAIVYSMYKPIADNNTDEVCALLSLYKKIYRIIGILILLIGLLLVPFLPKLIHGSYPKDANLSILYTIYLINTVLSYLFFSYKSSILNASQQSSIIYNINSLVIIIQSVIQIILLLLYKNYLLFLIVMPFFTLINNIIVAVLTKKKFPEYVCKGKVDKKTVSSIRTRVSGLFITKICTTTRNALDSVFISAMLGLNSVALYGNYYYIMSAVFSFTGIIISSMTASIGNSLVKESVKKNYHDMRKFDFIFSWLSGVCVICLLCLYQPFMKLWVGEKMMLPYYMVVLFAIYFYSLCVGSIRSAYHDAAGLWWEAKYRAIIETIMNIVLNYLLTKLFGIAGTVLSTIISILIVNFGYGTSIVFKYYFKNISMKEYFIDHLKYFITTLIASIIIVFITYNMHFNLIFELILKLIICMIASNGIFYIFYRNNSFLKESISMFKNILKRKKFN